MSDPTSTIRESVERFRSAQAEERRQQAAAAPHQAAADDDDHAVDLQNWVQVGELGWLPAASFSYLRDGFTHWNYVAIMLIANHLRTLKRHFYRGTGKSKKEVEAHPAIAFLQRPNPYYDLDLLIVKTVIHKKLTGSAYWKKIRDLNGQVRQLWPLRPDLTAVVQDRDPESPLYGGIKHYAYSSALGTIPFPPEDVIHIMDPHPVLEFLGYSMQEALGNVFQLDRDMAETELALFQNRGRIDSIISLDAKGSDSTRKQFEKEYKAKFGGPKKAGGSIYVQGGKVNVEPMRWSNADFEFEKLDAYCERRTLTAHFIPEGFFAKDATRANAEQADVIFNREAIVPQADQLNKAMNEVLQEFDPTLYCEYDNPVPKDRAFNMTYATTMYRSGLIKQNEAREFEDWEEVPEGDAFYTPSSGLLLSPGEMPSEAGAPPARHHAAAVEPAKRARLDTRAARLDHWKAYMRARGKKETALKVAVRQAFEWDRAQIKKRLKAMKGQAASVFTADYFPTAEEWAKAWREILEDAESAIFQTFGQRGIDALGGGGDLNLNFDLESPWIKNHFDKLCQKGIEYVTSTTKSELSALIKQSLKDGLNTADIAKAIDDKIDGWEAGKSRAYLVAQTETTKLSNGALKDGFQEVSDKTGFTVKKLWVTSGDEFVRNIDAGDEYDHAAADGQMVGLDEKFVIHGKNGDDYVDYPGDPSGAAGNVCGERCTMSAEFPEGESNE